MRPGAESRWRTRSTVCIDTSHKTWVNIAARKAFTVAFGTADTVASCDYLGIVSGNDIAAKVTKYGFTAQKSEFIDATVLAELPLMLKCKLVSMNEENCNVVDASSTAPSRNPHRRTACLTPRRSGQSASTRASTSIV